MADLSNLKISETYGRVLQKDPDTGVLQELTGAIPSSIIFDRTTLKYVDGNEQNNYVLTSDAQGNASWAASSGGDTDIYWSADTTPSDTVKYIRASGNTTSVKIGGDLEVTGDTYTSNLILSPDGSITPNTNNTSIYFRNKLPGAGTGTQEWMQIGDDAINLNMDGNPYMDLAPNTINFNSALDSVDYKWKQISFDNVLAAKIKGANHLYYMRTNVAVGQNASNQNWPTTDGLQNSTPDGALKIWGDMTVAPGSGQTGNLGVSANTQIAGNLSADTISARTQEIKEDIGISGNTYLGGGLGVSGNTDVKGFLSADTGVYSYNLFTSNITTTATSTDTLTIKSDRVDISSHGGSVEYLSIQDDRLKFFLDAGEAVAFQSPSHAAPRYIFNAGGQDIDFYIDGPTDENTFYVDVSQNRVRMMHHLMMGSSANVPNATGDNYGLSVTGSSLFYPGTASTNCINAPGPISADTITGETIISTYGSIYSANTNLLDIFQVASAATETSYWSADTTPSETVKYVRLSGNSTSAKIGGNLEVSGTTIINNSLSAYSQTIRETLGVSGNTTISADLTARGLYTTGGGLNLRPADAAMSYIVGYDTVPDVLFGIGTIEPAKALDVVGDIQLSADLYLDDGKKIFWGDSDTTFIWEDSSNLRLEAAEDILLYPDNDIIIGKDATEYAWFYGTEKEFHIDGDIYASENLSGDTMSGRTLTLKENLGVTGTTTLRSKVHMVSTLGISGNTFLGGGLGVSGDTYITGPLSADTMSGRTLTLKENLGVSGNTYFPDNGKAIFGAGDDLKIYHSGSHSIIQDSGTGDLHLKGNVVKVRGTSVSEDCAVFTENAGVELYYDNSKKFETTSNGVGMSGEIDMGTDKITNLGDPTAAQDSATKNYVDTQYAYQYITFVGNASSISDDDWVFPGANGISNHTWTGGISSADGLITGSSTIALTRTIQHSFIRVPAGTKLVGLEGALRSNTNDQAYAGLFTFLPDYEGPDTKDATLRILAQTPSSTNNVTNDPQSFKSWAAEADMHTFADGECIVPAIRRDSSSTQSLIGSLTIILKTLIT